MSSPVSTTTKSEQFATTDPGAAHGWLQAIYADFQPEEFNNTRDFRFRGWHTQLGRTSVARLQYSMSADNNVAPSDVLLIVEPSDGAMKVSLGRSEEVVVPGTPVLLPPHQAVSALWADTDAGCVCLQAADVERVAVETTGVETVALRFTGLRPMSPDRALHWNHVVSSLVDAVRRNPAIADNPLVAGQLTQLLAEAALETFPSTTLASHRRIPSEHAAPAVVRRAIDFIDENADREVTLSEIAAATGIGARGLQDAFLRHQDTTPIAYARRARMDRAHRELEAGNPAGPDAVRAVAARWGFADPDRFVTTYEETYGHPPGHSPRA